MPRAVLFTRVEHTTGYTQLVSDQILSSLHAFCLAFMHYLIIMSRIRRATMINKLTVSLHKVDVKDSGLDTFR